MRSQTQSVPTAWVTGAGGLIGSYFVRTAAQSAPDSRVIGLTRSELDLTNSSAVRARFEQERPRLIIHCAALSKVGACERDAALARQVNVAVTEFLAHLAEQISFVFLSTDLVFDGQKGNYTETAAVNPLSVYAETKVAAEKTVLRNPNHLVIRTSLNAGISPTQDRGFNEELRRAWAAGKATRLFLDEFRSPIAAIETTKAVWQLIQKNARGLYHIAGSERLSRFRIGQLLAARRSELDAKLESASLKEYSGPPRSPDTSLDCAKAEAFLGCELPGFSSWLESHPQSDREWML